MIFISGVGSKEEDLEFSQMIICPNCGAYGRISGFLRYSRLSLFFIPIFKWGKKYYMESSCCKSLFLLDKDIGEKVESKKEVNIGEEDLEIIKKGYRIERCRNCGESVDSEFEYCPKCGEKL